MTLSIKKALFAALFSAFFVAEAAAQDPHFSQFNAASWQLNPAMTGIFNGRYRVAANYRDQWASILGSQPFRTVALAADVRHNTNGNNYLAFGLGLQRDEAGAASFVQQTGSLGLSYSMQLSGGKYKTVNHFLVAGAQAGFGQNSLDWSGLWFSRQYDAAAEKPDFGLSNGEANQNASTGLYPDLSTGLLWHATTKKGHYAYAGAGLSHFNKPTVSFLGDRTEKLYSRLTVHAGGQLPVGGSDDLSLMPSFLFMRQGPAAQLNLGSMIRFSQGDKNEIALRAGAFVRTGKKEPKGFEADALIVATAIEYGRWTVGLSYDVNISSLNPASNSRGAFEASAVYVAPEKRRARAMKCPKL